MPSAVDIFRLSFPFDTAAGAPVTSVFAIGNSALSLAPRVAEMHMACMRTAS